MQIRIADFQTPIPEILLLNSHLRLFLRKRGVWDDDNLFYLFPFIFYLFPPYSCYHHIWRKLVYRDFEGFHLLKVVFKQRFKLL